MAEPLVDTIIRRIADAAEQYHRLVLLVAPSGAGKTAALQEVHERIAAPLVNVNLELSRRMLGCNERQRALQSPRFLTEIVAVSAGDVVLLDNIEILFDVSLKQDPLRLLQGISRNKTVVAALSGAINDEHMVYATPGHPEYKRYSLRDFLVVNLPPVPPVMLHHLPRFLARQAGEDRNAKLALIVMDGLAMDQWLVVRTALALRQPNFRFREESVFAWIPSLTSVSRQAAFAGKAPIFFPNSIWTTDKEPALWSQFWADQGFATNEVVYIKGLGEGGLETVSEALSHPMARVVGLVVDKVDRIMHGMEMGTAGMHNQVCQWAKGPYLNTLLNLLLDRGFRVYLTSDHGNVEAVGCGRPAEGAVADLRGERVRVYSDASLRDKVKDRFPAALEWPPVGLPEDYLPLLAPARQAFIQEDQRTVSHGGISVEELIVPLVQIERRGE